MKQPQAVHLKTPIDRKHVDILGVNVDSTTVAAVLRQAEVDIAKGKKFYIVTPNPEQIMLALTDSEFRNIINKADISIPDAHGIVQAYRFMSLPNPTNQLTKPFILFLQGLEVGISTFFNRKWLEHDLKVIRGRELFLDLIKLANKKGWKVYLLGGESGEAVGTQKSLEKNYMSVVFKARQGPMLSANGRPRDDREKIEEQETVKDINNFNPDLLFVGFGAPKQEKWLYRQLSQLNIGGAMVHGGTFRYVTGQVKLPPEWLSNLGLEWLWRFSTGSQKFSRIWTAFPKFPVTVYLHKLRD